jgi:hypothetical protein
MLLSSFGLILGIVGNGFILLLLGVHTNLITSIFVEAYPTKFFNGLDKNISLIATDEWQEFEGETGPKQINEGYNILTWKIQAANPACHAVLEFTHIDVRYVYDWVRVYPSGQISPHQNNYIDPYSLRIGPLYISEGNILIIQYENGEVFTDKRSDSFGARYIQRCESNIDPRNIEMLSATESVQLLDFPAGNAKYETKTEMFWLVQPSNNSCNVVVEIQQVRLTEPDYNELLPADLYLLLEGRDAVDNYLSLTYPGLGERFVGIKKNFTTAKYSYEIMIRLRTSSTGQERGFVAVYKQVCDQVTNDWKYNRILFAKNTWQHVMDDTGGESAPAYKFPRVGLWSIRPTEFGCKTVLSYTMIKSGNWDGWSLMLDLEMHRNSPNDDGFAIDVDGPSKQTLYESSGKDFGRVTVLFQQQYYYQQKYHRHMFAFRYKQICP